MHVQLEAEASQAFKRKRYLPLNSSHMMILQDKLYFTINSNKSNRLLICKMESIVYEDIIEEKDDRKYSLVQDMAVLK